MTTCPLSVVPNEGWSALYGPPGMAADRIGREFGVGIT